MSFVAAEVLLSDQKFWELLQDVLGCIVRPTVSWVWTLLGLPSVRHGENWMCLQYISQGSRRTCVIRSPGVFCRMMLVGGSGSAMLVEMVTLRLRRRLEIHKRFIQKQIIVVHYEGVLVGACLLVN